MIGRDRGKVWQGDMQQKAGERPSAMPFIGRQQEKQDKDVSKYW
jgi:hypothetical protein